MPAQLTTNTVNILLRRYILVNSKKMKMISRNNRMYSEAVEKELAPRLVGGHWFRTYINFPKN